MAYVDSHGLNQGEGLSSSESLGRQGSTTSTAWNSTDKIGESLTETNPNLMGRKSILEGFLTRDGSPIWVPVVQLPIYRTEDILEEFQKILETFGEDDKGQAMRLKLQSQELHSDMMAFKAANPIGRFEDFVKW
jgi:hypothetical protein